MTPRRDISMQPDEVARCLAAADEAVLAALGTDGVPTGALVPLRSHDDELRFSVATGSALAAAIDLDPRVCCIVEEFPDYYGIKGVMLHGRAVPDPADRSGRVSYRLTVRDVVSFDFAKLKERDL